MKHTVLIILSVVIAFALQASAAVVEAKSEADLYKNQSRGLNEKKIYTAGKGEILTLLREEDDMIMVRTKSGLEGWLRKSLVKVSKSKEGTGSFKMDEAKVQGFLDNPQAVYILDMSDPSFKPIKLDRSFSDNISSNIDKEQNQRLIDGNPKPEIISENK